MSSPAHAVPYDKDQVYDELKERLLSSGSLFEDDTFRADYSALGGNHENITWLRPKEITPDAEFIVGDASRHDINQGFLENCWFLSGMAALCDNKKLFNKVVDRTQGFTDDQYCGLFRFRFWRFGEWVDVCIDDRLPTRDGKLIFLEGQRKSRNEYWAALMEKAYAKIHGSYEKLGGGQPEIAMRDFTGGVIRTFELKKLANADDLHPMLEEALSEGALVGCGVNPMGVRVLACGLDTGHAYTITGAAEVNGTRLLRVRNPHGADGVEWNGAWSDDYKFFLHRKDEDLPEGCELGTQDHVDQFPRDIHKELTSNFETMVGLADGCVMRGTGEDPLDLGFQGYRAYQFGFNDSIVFGENPTADFTKCLAFSKGSEEWKSVDEATKQELGLNCEHDGEFWISWADFLKFFDTTSICNLGADNLCDTDDDDIGWKLSQFNGSWISGQTAGGCRNFRKTFHMNPHYRITLTDITVDDDNMCNCYVSLIHKEKHGERKGYMEYFRGINVYKCEGEHPKPEDLIWTRPVVKMTYTNASDVSSRFKLPPGEYLVVPTTFRPDKEADFLLRFFSEGPLGAADDVTCEDGCPLEEEPEGDDADLGVDDPWARYLSGEGLLSLL